MELFRASHGDARFFVQGNLQTFKLLFECMTIMFYTNIQT